MSVLKTVLAFLAVALSLSVFGQGYVPASNGTAITFSIKNFGINVEGAMNEIAGQITFDPTNLTKSIFDVTLQTSSLNTGIDLRDSHLKKEEYFDVENYPSIRFISSTIVKLSDSGYRVTGLLKIKETEKEVIFPFTVQKSTKNDDTVIVFSGSFAINRRDFGVGGRSFSMADEVQIDLKVNTMPSGS
ncbi:MAG: YceI family protein [Imperialibacter sp.]|uniref:YceI family protein n=1 Tax=Imperialibacter sp. TaxID=2038411 RepID=UPI0032F098F7